MLVNKATLGAVLALLYVTPVSAQWEMEESAETDPLRSRPAAMAASLYDTEHRLVWEYACFRALSGSYRDSLDLYIEGNDGEQFTSGAVLYRFDDGAQERVRWNNGLSWLTFHLEAERLRFLGLLARFQSLELEVTTNRGAVTATFDLEGTTDMLRQVACPA